MAATTSRKKLPAWARTRSRPRDRESGFLKPRRCSLYLPGHSVHWIQAQKSERAEHEVGILTEVDGDRFVLDFGTDYRTYRNHEIERLIEIVPLGKGVRICERYRIVRTRSNHLFSIATSMDSWGACDDSPLTSFTPGALASRIETHGGFSVPGRLVVEAIRREDSGKEVTSRDKR